MPKIRTLLCCGREQPAEFIEIPIPEDIFFFHPEVEHFYIGHITKDKCYNSKCHGTLKRIGVTYLKDIIVLPGKIKYLPVYIREAKGFPDHINIQSKKNNQDNRFYLYCNVHGKIERCYSNFSTLKLGLIPDYYEQNKELEKRIL